MYGKQMLLSKLSTMAYLTMVVLLSWQLLTQYTANEINPKLVFFTLKKFRVNSP